MKFALKRTAKESPRAGEIYSMSFEERQTASPPAPLLKILPAKFLGEGSQRTPPLLKTSFRFQERGQGVRRGRIKSMPYNFCPRCGHELVLREKDDARLRPTCLNCKYTVYANPGLAVGVLVTDEKKRVCLILRGEEPRLGYWGLPAGFMEGDETAENGAVRECFEETGLEVALDGLFEVYSFAHPNRTRSGLLIVYRAHIIGGAPRAGTDTTDVKFFAADEIPFDALAFPTHRAALERWRKGLV